MTLLNGEDEQKPSTIDADIHNENRKNEWKDDQSYPIIDIGPVTIVPIASLLLGDSPRLAGEDATHTQMLANVESPLPPIIVHRRTMQVIDGTHRLRAAMVRGNDEIEVRFFDGTEELAFLLAVKENTAHGLPLPPADREAAAARIIASRPQWSDRAIAAATGLAAKTVAAVRQRSTEHSPQLNARIGRDGRIRPLDGARGRLLASEIIEARPDVPLREIAQQAGVSVATAHDVRERIRRGQDPLPPRQRATGRGTGGGGDRFPSSDLRVLPRPAARGADPISWPSIRLKLQKDPALKYVESGRSFLQWFDAHTIDSNEWETVIKPVPSHWASDIAVLARSCAQTWLDIAQALEHDGQITA